MVKIRAKKDCPHGGYVRGEVIDASKVNEEGYIFMDKVHGKRYRPKDEFDIVEDQSPIRTVTRKEIVPGVYGDIEISDVNNDGVSLWLPRNQRWSSEKLREAAHILNQIAEALEDGNAI